MIELRGTGWASVCPDTNEAMVINYDVSAAAQTNDSFYIQLYN